MTYGFVGPAGSNKNYVAQILTGTPITPMLSYHHNENGSHHTSDNLNWKPFAPQFDDAASKSLKDPNMTVIQMIVQNKSHWVILNWFEKLSRGDKDDQRIVSDWEVFANEAWQVSQSADVNLTRAVLHWFYRWQNDDEEIRDVPAIKHKFSVDSFYDDDTSKVINEFAKFGVDYTVDMHEIWRESQSIVFKSHALIQEKMNYPLELDLYWQRGIAMGLHGVANGMDENNAWETWYGRN